MAWEVVVGEAVTAAAMAGLNEGSVAVVARNYTGYVTGV